MTMHLVRGLSSLNTRKRMSKTTKKSAAQLAEYNRYRTDIGLEPLSSFVAPRAEGRHEFRPLKIDMGPRRGGGLDYKTLPSKKDTEHVVVARSVMDPRSLAKESPEVRAAIIAKSQRLAPAYNKGAVQYITDEADISDIGRKK